MATTGGAQKLHLFFAFYVSIECRILLQSLRNTNSRRVFSVVPNNPRQASIPRGEISMPIADERAKAVELALSQIEKQFGKGSIVRLGSKEALLPIAVISTGSISFDAALGVGGVPRGRAST